MNGAFVFESFTFSKKNITLLKANAMFINKIILNLFLIFLLTLVNQKCLAQWVPEGTTWHIHEDDINQNFPSNGYVIYKAADTIIAGKKCTNVYSGDKKSIYAIMLSEEHKLYTYDFYKKQFQLLFDFNKHDTSYNYIQSGDTFNVEVTHLDSINVNGYYLRRQVLSFNGHSDLAIEGVGTLTGILPEPLFHSADGPTYRFECVTNDFFGTYPSSATNCDKLVGGVANLVYYQTKLSAYPNPAASVLNIRVQLLKGKGMLSVYNMKGQKVYESAILPGSGETTVQSISVENFTAGIYAVVLQQGMHSTNIKIDVK